ncbi:MAG TPA: tetratricopeptide repeat protein [Terracidiphilus sp.]|jgi:cytochrome c-type biogenesis protein CcmH/NrfG
MQAISLQREWTNKQALIFVTLCLMAGITGGWFVRGAFGIAPHTSAQAAIAPPAPSPSFKANTTPAQPTPASLKQMADAQAAPLLTKLNAHPKNADLLTSIGNLYYDAQQYPIAIDYYNRALQSKPSDSSVRTDMATAYWYLGRADQAIAQFDKALTYAPDNPNTLFNRGLVKWQGKHDAAGAIADWKKLLATTPNYEQKDKVQQMLSDVEKQTSATPSAKN